MFSPDFDILECCCFVGALAKSFPLSNIDRVGISEVSDYDHDEYWNLHIRFRLGIIFLNFTHTKNKKCPAMLIGKQSKIEFKDKCKIHQKKIQCLNSTILIFFPRLSVPFIGFFKFLKSRKRLFLCVWV